MQAVESLGLPVEPIGCCENDPEVAAELAVAYPHVPNHGDMRTVIAAMENGELELHPDIVVFTVPCQARSRARLYSPNGMGKSTRISICGTYKQSS